MKQVHFLLSRFFSSIIFLFIVLSVACSSGGNESTPGNGNLSDSSALLTWEGPTVNANTNSTLLSDLAGYRVYMSTTSGVYTASDVVADISATSTGGGNMSYQIDDLPAGKYYFSVTAYDSANPENESEFAVEVSKTIP